MKGLFRYIFRLAGLEVHKIHSGARPARTVFNRGESTMEAGLYRLKTLGINPSAIVDLGAAAGTWSLKARTFFPDPKYLLFEPLEERKQELNRLATLHKNFIPVFAAAGSVPGKVKFIISPDLDGSGVYDGEQSGDYREVDQVTVDSKIKDLNISGPYILKFDTHGFEVPILQGCQETLKDTDAVIMECYGFHLSSSSLLIHEMIEHMSSLGFRVADIVDIMRRPTDYLFWQCDLIFLKSNNPHFRSKTYA